MGIQAVTPFWGEQTSYLNFCEEDYAITRYIAEFINTLSSLIYIVYGIYGLRRLSGKPGAAMRSLVYYGLMGVGVCSGAYHLSLKYHTQMSDELSMHLTTAPLLHRVLTFGKSQRYTNVLGAIMSVAWLIGFIIHATMDEFLLHAVSFAVSVYIIGIKTSRLLSERVKNPVYRAKAQGMARFGVLAASCGYIVWLIDRWVCDSLIKMRGVVGLPLAFLFELHGWWHVLTCIGAYTFIALVDYITTEDVDKDPVELLAWPSSWAAESVFAPKKHLKDQ
ncbi:hypothetical protein DTO271G3_5196 [Paecilomyces variotii]|nr:hypothetical protein DTO271G3_5196 [Paecilomyces variotii]